MGDRLVVVEAARNLGSRKKDKQKFWRWGFWGMWLMCTGVAVVALGHSVSALSIQ